VHPVILAKSFHEAEEFLGGRNLRSMPLVFPHPLDETALTRDPLIGSANVALDACKVSIVHTREIPRHNDGFPPYMSWEPLPAGRVYIV